VATLDYFIVLKVIVADFLKFVSVKVSAKLLYSAVEPVLSVPAFRGEANCFGGNWSINVFFSPFVIHDIVVNYREYVVE